MDAVRNFLRQIDEPGRRDQPQFFAWLAADAGKFDEVATLAGHLSEPGNFGPRRIGIGRGGEFSGEQKPRNAHRLVAEDLFLIFFNLAPFQDVFESNDRGLKFESGLEEQREFHRRNDVYPRVGRTFVAFLRRLAFHQIVVADIDHRERRGGRVRIGILQEPAQKKFLGPFEARLAEEKNP